MYIAPHTYNHEAVGKCFVYQPVNPRNDHNSAVGSFKSELWEGLFDAKPTKDSVIIRNNMCIPCYKQTMNRYIPFFFVVTWFCL